MSFRCACCGTWRHDHHHADGPHPGRAGACSAGSTGDHAAAAVLGRDAEPGRSGRPGRRLPGEVRDSPAPGGGGGTLSTMNPLIDPDARYDPQRFYNYVVEIPAGTGTGLDLRSGLLRCERRGRYRGTLVGEQRDRRQPHGNPTRRPVSSFFDLYDTRTSLLDIDDDIFIAGTGSTFRRQSSRTMPCSTSWTRGATATRTTTWTTRRRTADAERALRLVPAGHGARPGIYRLHSTPRTPRTPPTRTTHRGERVLVLRGVHRGHAADLRAGHDGGVRPAARAAPAPASTSPRINAVHAGKKMIVNLWDPGDTNELNAAIHILHPPGPGSPTRRSTGTRRPAPATPARRRAPAWAERGSTRSSRTPVVPAASTAAGSRSSCSSRRTTRRRSIPGRASVAGGRSSTRWAVEMTSSVPT